MPIFDVTAPDGAVYRVNAPEGATEKEAISYAQNLFNKKAEPEPEAPPQPFQATPETGFSSFIPAVKRGALGIASLGGDILPAMAGRVGEKLGIKGAKEYADRQMAEAVQSQQNIERNYPSAVPSYTNIKGAGDLLTYIVEAVGETIPSVLPSIFTGGAAGVIGRGAVIAAKEAAEKAVIAAAAKGVAGAELESLAMKAGVDAARKTALKYEVSGALVGSAAQNIPDVYQSIAQSTGKEELGVTLVSGGFNTILDAITPLNLMRIARKRGLSPDELIGGWVKRLGKGFAQGLITEGGTEAAQEMSTAAAEKFVDQNKNFFTRDNFVRFIDAGLKGGLGGGVLTGATNVAFNRATPPPPSAKEPPEEAAPETAAEPTTVPPTTPTSMFDEAGNLIRSTQATPEEIVASKIQAETTTKPTAEQIKADEKTALAGTETIDFLAPTEEITKLKADNKRIQAKLANNEYPTPKAIAAANAKILRQQQQITTLETQEAAKPKITPAEIKPPEFTGLTPEAAKLVEQVTAGFLPQGLDDATIKRIAKDNLVSWSPGFTPKELIDGLIAKQGATNADINATPSGKSIEVPGKRDGLLPTEGAGESVGVGLADAEGDVNAVVGGKRTQPTALVKHNKEKDVWSYDNDKELVESEGPLTLIQHKSGVAKEQGITKTYIDGNRITFDLDNGGNIIVELNQGKTSVRLNKPDKIMGTRPAESFYEDIDNIQQDKNTFGLDKLQNFLPPKLAQAIQNAAKTVSNATQEVADPSEFIKSFLKEAIDSDGYSALWGEKEKSAEQFKKELKGISKKEKELSAEDQTALQDELAAELNAEEAPTEVTPKDYINSPSEYAAVAPGTKETAIKFAAHERVYDQEDKKAGEFTEKQEEIAEKREAFIESLAPEEKAKVEKISKEVSKKQEVAKEARSKQRVKTADSATLARRAARKNEYKKALRAIKREEIAASAEKDLEEVKSQKETALPGQKAFIGKTAYEKERVVKNLERDINELGDIDDVLKTISDEKANTSATRSTAKKLKELIKNLDIDIDIVFGEVEANRDGKFDPVTNTITMAGKDGKYTGTRRLDSAVLHEIMHYLTDHIFTDTKAYLNSIKDPVKRKDVRAALVRLQNNYNYVKSKLGNKYDLSTIKEFIAEAYSNPDFQMDMGMLPPSSTYTKAINFFTELARNIARAFGFSDAEEATTYKEVLEDIAQIIAVAPTAELRGTEVSYLKSDVTGLKESVESSKVHKNIDFEQHIANQVNNLNKKLETPSAHKIKQILTTKEGGNWLTKMFQNRREVLRRIHISLERQGVLRTMGDMLNDVDGQFNGAAAISDNFDRRFNKTPRDKIIELTGRYAKAAGITQQQALVNLSTYLEVLHEPERRLVKWLMTVPLSNEEVLKIKRADGTEEFISPATRRSEILDALNSYKEPDVNKRHAVVKKLREELDAIVNDKANLGVGITDINDAKYNVVGGLSSEKIESFKQELLNKPEVKPYLSTFKIISKNIQILNENNKELNKRGNFWTAPVDNWATFYDFKNYVPFKGKPDTEIEDSKFDANKKMLVGLQEGIDGMSGRESDSDNIVIQVMIDTVNAARRAGYKDVTFAIKNSVLQSTKPGQNKLFDFKKDGGTQIISGKTTTIPFDNNRAENIKKERGQNKIFHYEPDGSITVIELTNKEQREAIRNSYKEDHPFVNMLNSVTSGIGQMHTRYNPSFAPINFTGDLMMNIFTMGAEFGPVVSAQLLKNISIIVGTGGLYKAGKVAVLYNKSGTKELQKYIDPKSKDYDPFYADLVEYLERGGKVSYMQAFDTRSQTSQTLDTIKRGGKSSTKESVDAVIDTWSNMFEFASRAASYKTAKEIYQKQNTDKGMNPTEATEDAKNRATYYAKNLANFEQVGEYGKIFGAFYMFARPAATGAVRAIEALTPLFRAIGGEKFDDTLEGRALAQQAKTGGIMVLGLLGLGVASYAMSVMMADDDDDNRNRTATDDMDRWQKYMRFHIPKALVGGKEDVILQMRWGYGLGAFASAGAQIAALGAGNSSFKKAGGNIVQVGLDSFLPLPISRINMFDNTSAWILDSVTPSAFRPFLEYTMNLDGLGREIYNNRQTRLGDAYTGGDSIPEMYKSAARMLFDSTDGGVDISPNTMYFFANNGVDGLAKITGGMYNIGLVAAGDKAFNPKTDTLLFDSFFGSKSNFDARSFSLVEKQIKEVDKRIKTLETDPEKYINYVGENPNAVAAVEFYNKAVNQDLKTLRSEANRIRGDRTYTPKERKELLDNITQMSNMVKRNLLMNFESLGYTP